MTEKGRPIVLMTGAAGGIGTRLSRAVKDNYEVVGLDLDCGDVTDCYEFDITSSSSIGEALKRIRETHGDRIASVVHLAAYFDFTGEESPLYDSVNVEGTRNLLDALQDFDVEQFLYTSAMLVHAPTEPGVLINEESDLDARWAYPQSKLETERVIDDAHGDIPTAVLRLGGVYDDRCGVPTLSHQIQRIYERRFKSHLFSGDPARGQSFVHLDDAIDAMVRTIERREKIDDGTRILIGEPRAVDYETLQNRIGMLTHGESWTTVRVPKPVATAGAWLEEKAEPLIPDAIDKGEKPFIRPFKASLADDHYEIDVSRAHDLLDWEPQHRLMDELPAMIEALKDDPETWYRSNGLDLPAAPDDTPEDESPEGIRSAYANYRRSRHRQNLWAHWLAIGMGSWLVTSPPILNYESTALAISDVICGLLITLFGFASLSWKREWARAANGLIGIYLLFAPLIFWAPTASAYLNDTFVGALVIGLSMLVRPPVGVGLDATLGGPDVPPAGTTVRPPGRSGCRSSSSPSLASTSRTIWPHFSSGILPPPGIRFSATAPSASLHRKSPRPGRYRMRAWAPSPTCSRY